MNVCDEGAPGLEAQKYNLHNPATYASRPGSKHSGKNALWSARAVRCMSFPSTTNVTLISDAPSEIMLTGISPSSSAAKTLVTAPRVFFRRSPTTQKMALSEIKNENDRLRRLLDLKLAWPDVQLSGADIIAQDISLIYKTAILDKGYRDGFYVDMPIIQPQGLVGRVISVSANTSQVLLITDVNSAVPAIVENRRIRGIIKGLENGKLSFDYVRSDEEIKPGDRIVTSGLLEIFPKGLLIGTVRSIKRPEHKMFAEIIVEPFVRFDKAEEVFGVGRILEKKH